MNNRYPQKTRKAIHKWWVPVASADRVASEDVTITTGDDPTLSEAMNASPLKKEMRLEAIAAEKYSLDSTGT